MPDQVLVRDGPVAVPLDYPVPQSGELVPLMVRATLDGTSASQAFYASVQVIAPSGRVMGTAISSPIAAGASADVTWFPGAELTEEGNAFGSFTTETLFLDTRSSSVSTVGSLETNAVYAISVQGTMNDWNLADNVGAPDADALFPTAGGAARISTQVGIDPDTIFAYPSSHPQALGHWTQFQMNLGSGWAHVEPDGGPFTTRQANNVYTYSVVGQGQPIQFRIDDSPRSDNYGYFKIVVFAGSTGGGGGGSGTVTSVAAADTSIVIAGTATDPTVRTATLDVIAADHPPAADWSNNSHKITNVTDPTSTHDAATKNYVDTTTSGSSAVGFEIGYAQITATVNITDTAEATATALISSGALTFDGGPVIVEFFSPEILTDTGAAGDTVTVTLWEGATQIGRLGALKTIATTAREVAALGLRYRFTPSAGSHSYKLCAFVQSTAGTPQIVAGAGGTGAFTPAFLRFTKV